MILIGIILFLCGVAGELYNVSFLGISTIFIGGLITGIAIAHIKTVNFETQSKRK
jgi:hypothetical protein